MVKKHLKTLTVPRSWPIKRKGQKFVVRPNPGKAFALSMPIALIFKNLLKYCKTTKEVKTLLKDKEVFVDGKRVQELRSLVGVMDVLSIPISNENYRMVINKNKKLLLMPITKEDAAVKVSKIIGKTQLKKGKIQLNLSDGRNLLVNEDKYTIGDSLLLTLPKQEIKGAIKLEKGAIVFLMGGKHTGESGTVDHIDKGSVTVKNKEGAFETPKRYVFVIGKDKPLINMLD